MGHICKQTQFFGLFTTHCFTNFMFGIIVGSPVGNEFAALIDTLCLLGSKFLGRVGLLVVISGSEAIGCSKKRNEILEIYFFN